MKSIKKVLAMMLVIVLMSSGIAFANGVPPTQGDIDISTSLGMEWLAAQQNIDGPFVGSWGLTGYNLVGKTGLALLKFETHAWDTDKMSPLDPAYEYYDEVRAGLDFLLGLLVDSPDGMFVADPFDSYHVIYNTSIALMAIANSGEYLPIVQSMVDYFAFAQTDAPYDGRGGWGYEPNETFSDNSHSGYVSMALAYAESFGATVPQIVKDELALWVGYIQGADGGSGYSTPNSWHNILKTGNLLQQMNYVGISSGDPAFDAALDFINNEWNEPAGIWAPYTGWRGGGDAPTAHYQATFTMMKGLEVNGIEVIPNALYGGDWFGEVADVLLSEQNPDGSWPDEYFGTWVGGDCILSTAWALLTLQKVAPPPAIIEVDINIKPGSFPNAVNPKPKGVLPVAILGSEDFDVMSVDCMSIMITMEGTEMEFEPLRCEYEDVASDPPVLDPDGYMDIILHFSMEDVFELIGPDPEGEIELIITGVDMDEFAFMGSDVIWIVPQKN